MSEKNKATLFIHQGVADLFSNNGIINYYLDKYNEIILNDDKRTKIGKF